jgi:Fuc2NAc and GlcNAc transferase
MNWFLILPIATFLSLILTALIRRYALSNDLMDIPNSRSSHSSPTPRSGGMAFIISFLLLAPILTTSDDFPLPVIWAFWGGGIWISIIGFSDDHKHIAARWRLLAHFIGAAWVLIWLGGFPPLLILGLSIDMGWLGHTLAAVYLVWLLNLYNFMDGIDGIASIEAITVCAGAALIIAPLSPYQSIWLLPLLLAASVLGFLFWNFPPAKIFMGDAGSGFLGLMVGGLSIQATLISPHMFWVWVILLGAFIVDSTLTLFRRLIKGEKIYEAHRSHAYQVASHYLRSHKAVSLTIGLINLLWLFPVAYLVGKQRVDGLVGVMIAYTPLVWLFIFVRSKLGKPKENIIK